MKYIILDFDGTIGDSQALIVRTFQDTMRKMGKEVKSAEECAGTIGMRLSEAFALLYNSPIEEGEKCAEVYRDIFEENKDCLGMNPFPMLSKPSSSSTSRNSSWRWQAAAVGSRCWVSSIRWNSKTASLPWWHRRTW